MAALSTSMLGQTNKALPLQLQGRTSSPSLAVRRPRALAVRAAATGPGSPKTKSDIIQTVRQGCDQFLQRYDVLSCGLGALACTSIFVHNGQNPIDALWITAAATVTGLVANELFFD